jgi:hypothetical protein
LGWLSLRWSRWWKKNLTATSFVAFNWTSRINFDFARCICGTRWWSDAVLNLRCHRHKGLFNVSRILCRCFKEWNSQLIGIFLKYKKKYTFCHFMTFLFIISLSDMWYYFENTHGCRGCVDDFLCRQITFVAYK